MNSYTRTVKMRRSSSVEHLTPVRNATLWCSFGIRNLQNGRAVILSVRFTGRNIDIAATLSLKPLESKVLSKGIVVFNCYTTKETCTHASCHNFHLWNDLWTARDFLCRPKINTFWKKAVKKYFYL